MVRTLPFRLQIPCGKMSTLLKTNVCRRNLYHYELRVLRYSGDAHATASLTNPLWEYERSIKTTSVGAIDIVVSWRP